MKLDTLGSNKQNLRIHRVQCLEHYQRISCFVDYMLMGGSGWNVIRGSSTDGGKKAYVEMIEILRQNKNVFAGLSVEENLEIGAFLINAEYKKVIDEIYELFPILKEKRGQLVGELSGGQRQQRWTNRHRSFF